MLKDADPAELELALTAVTGGDTYLSPPVSRHVIDAYVRRVSDRPEPLAELTPRQREVLQLVAEGRTTRQIAQELGVSVKTVETHRAQLMDRLDIHDIAGLVRFAVRTGVVSADE
jgi:DNA-binding NarL/FixJ family response regulator